MVWTVCGRLERKSVRRGRSVALCADVDKPRQALRQFPALRGSEAQQDALQLALAPGNDSGHQVLSARGELEHQRTAVRRVGFADDVAAGREPVDEPGHGRRFEAECVRYSRGADLAEVSQNRQDPVLGESDSAAENIDAAQGDAGQQARGFLQHFDGAKDVLLRVPVGISGSASAEVRHGT